MKYLIVCLLAAVITGCASKGPGKPVEDSSNRPIYIDQRKLEDEKTATYYLAYSIAKSTWEPSYLPDGTPDQLAREVYARTTMLEIWKEGKKNDPGKAHPVLDAMENIMDAGYLREVTWLKHRDILKNRPDDLDIEGFSRWIKNNPEQLVQADDL